MPKAARVGDPTQHNGKITGPGCPDVSIGGQPAATVGDDHSCPIHRGGPIDSGSSTVFFNGKPAARVGDTAQCGPGKDVIADGCATVEIG